MNYEEEYDIIDYDEKKKEIKIKQNEEPLTLQISNGIHINLNKESNDEIYLNENQPCNLTINYKDLFLNLDHDDNSSLLKINFGSQTLKIRINKQNELKTKIEKINKKFDTFVDKFIKKINEIMEPINVQPSESNLNPNNDVFEIINHEDIYNDKKIL